MNQKNKLLRAFVAIAMMLIGWLPSLAYDFQVDCISYNIISSTKVEVTSSPGSSGNVVIPEKVTYSGTTYSVTKIGDKAFYLCSGLTSLSIGNSVTEIGDEAFYFCSGLTNVTIGNSLTEIEVFAFNSCYGLTSVVWNAKNCNDFSTYSGIFDSNNITSFTFGNNVERIPACLCYNMSNLTSITISNSVTEIGDYAFSSCSGLTGVTIPNSVTKIGWGAFTGCI